LLAFNTIGTSEHHLNVNTAHSIPQTSLSTSSGGNTYITKRVGDLYLNTLATQHGVASITVKEGSMFNGNRSAIDPSDPKAHTKPLNEQDPVFSVDPFNPYNVASGKAYLFAGQDIGRETDHLRTLIGSLEAQSEAGGTWVDNTGGLTVVDNIRALPDGGMTSNPMGMQAGGKIVVSASSPIIIKSNVIADGDITYVAKDGKPFGKTAPDDIVFEPNARLTSVSGNITLMAADSILYQGVGSGDARMHGKDITLTAASGSPQPEARSGRPTIRS